MVIYLPLMCGECAGLLSGYNGTNVTLGKQQESPNSDDFFKEEHASIVQQFTNSIGARILKMWQDARHAIISMKR